MSIPRRSQFKQEAIDAGFTEEQSDFMDSMLAKCPHSHELEDIEGIEVLEDGVLAIEE